jgi:hypothetical protein
VGRGRRLREVVALNSHRNDIGTIYAGSPSSYNHGRNVFKGRTTSSSHLKPTRIIASAPTHLAHSLANIHHVHATLHKSLVGSVSYRIQVPFCYSLGNEARVPVARDLLYGSHQESSLGVDARFHFVRVTSYGSRCSRDHCVGRGKEI